ncbi:MAG: tetratricopeptide repeat protein [Acidobacteriota bacterium]
MLRNQKLFILFALLAVSVMAITSLDALAQDPTGRPTKTPPKTPSKTPAKNPDRTPVKTPPKTPPAPTVILTVLSDPPDSTVFINGNKRGTTNEEGKYQLEKLPLGRYTVEVKKDGYLAGSQIFDAGTESPTLVFKLQPDLEEPTKQFESLIAAGSLIGTEAPNAYDLVLKLASKYPNRPEVEQMRGVLAAKLVESAKPTIMTSVTNWRKVGRDEMARSAEAATKAVELKPDDTRTQVEAAYLRAITALRDWQTGSNADGLNAAKTELEGAIAKDEAFAPAQYQLGVAKLFESDFGGAESAFLTTLKLEPRWAVAYIGLGNAYRIGLKYKEAIETFRKALDIEKNNAAAQAGLGLARALKGEKDGIKDMEKAVQWDSTSGLANYHLGIFFSNSKKNNDLDRAMRELNTAMQKNTGNLEFQNSKAEQLIAEIQKKRKK